MTPSDVALRKAARRADASPRAKRVPMGERFTAAHIWPAVLAVVAFVAVVVALQDRSGAAVAAGGENGDAFLAGSNLAAELLPGLVPRHLGGPGGLPEDE